MKFSAFAIPYADDLRMKYVCDYLTNNNYTYSDEVKKADFVILPVLTKPYMFEDLDEKVIFHGMSKINKGFNYFENENYVLKNAILTAEGAVTLLEEETDFSLSNSKILILGYGRIGKALHKILNGYGADVTICSRSNESKTAAVFNKAKHIYFDELKSKSNYDFVINTVPHIVLTKQELKALNKNTIILDLASFPGGVDTLVADSLGIKVLSGKGMPSKYTAKTAGYIIGETVQEIIEEGI